MKRLRSASAFTLIELLVVIVIIGLLAALLLPAINSAIKRGHQTTSLSNLRQWYAGITSTVANNDGLLPLPGNPFDTADVNGWYNCAAKAISEVPYTGFVGTQKPVYGKRSTWVNPAVPQAMWKQYGFPFNYGFNENLIETRDTTAGSGALRQAAIQSPALTILMGEKADAIPTLNITNVKAYFSSNDPVGDDNATSDLLFCDGHAEAVKRSVFANKSLTTDADALDNLTTTVSWLPYGNAVRKEPK